MMLSVAVSLDMVFSCGHFSNSNGGALGNFAVTGTAVEQAVSDSAMIMIKYFIMVIV